MARKKNQRRTSSDGESAGRDWRNPLRGTLSDEHFTTYQRIPAAQERRAGEWRSILKPEAVPSLDFRRAVLEFAPVPTCPEGLQELVEFLMSALGFGYMAPLLTDEQWANESTQRYLPYAQLDVACLVRSLSLECEVRGISSERLALLASDWQGLFRGQAGPRDALILFEGRVPPDELKSVLSATTQRLLRQSEMEMLNARDAAGPEPKKKAARKKRGRKRQYDPVKDEKLVEDFQVSGMTETEFEGQKGLDAGSVRKAKDRVKSRKRRRRR